MMTRRSVGLKWLAGRFLRSRSGAVSIEYVLIAGMVSILIVPTAISIGEALQTLGFESTFAAIRGD